ncbi:MocR-like pyridoxine biosynthesis transcription factor PdxR [Actinocatenispora comari]|uniref:GntR family transcriptional regulator n=1 Tax=Actinocatenispora comari TaxID=2807577 RepID=A0A8J4AL80_9ACTN|nr:PLP-dependent aminotransferase family protein [Actinocatenispora comari]GIL31487.1 GntR family transcriptional regulator [Actinocatenispora comari]
MHRSNDEQDQRSITAAGPPRTTPAPTTPASAGATPSDAALSEAAPSDAALARAAPSDAALSEAAPSEAAPGKAAPGEGADFLGLDPGTAPGGRVTDWLTDRIRAAIGDGRLPVGARLPAGRTLAADLHVSRGVVTGAYQRLADEGHLVGRGRAGTVVVGVPAPARSEPAAPAPTPAGSLFAAVPGPDVFDRLRAAPARIDLTPGVPDLTAFPRAAWLRAERAVLADLASDRLGYGDPRGMPALRAAIVDWLARYRGIRADPADLVVVAGTAQSLTLLGRILAGGGAGRIAVEDPGSLGTRQHLAAAGLATEPVPVDAEGLVVDRLAATGAPAVLVTPAHQFPTGVVLSGARRRALAAWAAGGGLVIEDDYDSEHRYDRAPAPALHAMAPDRVIYLGSGSKTLAPALRIGWILVPPAYRSAVIEAKRYADLGNATLPQLVLARLMADGGLERQLRTLRARHRRRRDAMIAVIAARLPAATVGGAAAGLHLTVTLPLDRPDTEVAAAALDAGVKVHPLSWHRQTPGEPGFVLGYAARTAGEIDAGVALLAAALAAR